MKLYNVLIWMNWLQWVNIDESTSSNWFQQINIEGSTQFSWYQRIYHDWLIMTNLPQWVAINKTIQNCGYQDSIMVNQHWWMDLVEQILTNLHWWININPSILTNLPTELTSTNIPQSQNQLIYSMCQYWWINPIESTLINLPECVDIIKSTLVSR